MLNLLSQSSCIFINKTTQIDKINKQEYRYLQNHINPVNPSFKIKYHTLKGKLSTNKTTICGIITISNFSELTTNIAECVIDNNFKNNITKISGDYGKCHIYVIDNKHNETEIITVFRNFKLKVNLLHNKNISILKPLLKDETTIPIIISNMLDSLAYLSLPSLEIVTGQFLLMLKNIYFGLLSIDEYLDYKKNKGSSLIFFERKNLKYQTLFILNDLHLLSDMVSKILSSNKFR